jgi:hypothetical protein
MFKDRWPGCSTQHRGACAARARVSHRATKYVVVDYLPYGAFLRISTCSVGWRFACSRAWAQFDKAIYLYFGGQLIVPPALPFLNRLNFAMQTVVCRKA